MYIHAYTYMFVYVYGYDCGDVNCCMYIDKLFICICAVICVVIDIRSYRYIGVSSAPPMLWRVVENVLR